MAKVELDIRAQIGELNKGLKNAQTGLKKLEGQSEKTNKAMQQNMKETGKFASDLKSTFVGVFAIGTAVSLAKSILNVRVEFEKFNAMLKVALGSAEAANREFDKIQKFAAETPFSVRELTDSFVRLVNQGFKPTTKQMRAMGDIAAAMGKDFIQLAEAVIDAQVGEFERLKEFGIRASKEGDQVTLAFKGVEKQMDFTASAIQEAIIEFGQMDGVMGTMEEVSKTLGGQISMLGDAVTTLADSLGEMSSGEVSNGITALKSVTEIITTLIDLKPEFDEEGRTGLIGFLNKVNESLLTMFAVTTAGSVGGGKFRELIAGTLEGISGELKDFAEDSGEIIEDEFVPVVEVEIETLKSLQGQLKKLQDQQKELDISDKNAIARKNIEIETIKEQITELNKLGVALKVKTPKIEDLEIDDGFEDAYKEQGKEQLRFEKWINGEITAGTKRRVDEDLAIMQAAEDTKKLLAYGTAEAVMSGLDLIAAANKDNAKIQQAVSIAQAIINGALGITKTGAQLGYPAAIPFQIALGLQTLAQIATIRSQKYERGGYDVLKGRRHAQGGIQIGLGDEAEDGEGRAIFTRQATQKYGKFLPAFVKAINENTADVTEGNAYSFNFDDSRSVGKLEDIRKLLAKPDVTFEKGYKVITRNGQVTKVKV